MSSTRSIRLIAWMMIGAWSCAGCAPWAGPRVRETPDGQYVVEVGRRGVSFEDLAQRVYGDPRLGSAIAELNDLPVSENVPAGTLLVLPPRESLEDALTDVKTADVHFEEGLAAVDAGNYREGAERFREALEVDPGRIDVLYNLGLALEGAGELEEATQVLRESVRRRPEDAEIRYALGSVLRRRGAYPAALGEFERALSIDRRHSKAAFARARTFEDLRKPDEARRAWEEFLREFPDSRWSDRARASLEALEAGPPEGDRSGS